ncbi:hypothetical protein SF123566_3564 [Shigella flexneri 1235-66]|nr:hypothetical protein SF123566_3564 [Shigella flexneri 1235-66]
MGRRLSSSPHQQYEDELRQNECKNAAFLAGTKQAVSQAQPTPTSIQIVCGHSCQR